MRGVDPRFEFELVQHIPLELMVSDHGNPPTGRWHTVIARTESALIHVNQEENGSAPTCRSAPIPPPAG
jgi:hypothetical protein